MKEIVSAFKNFFKDRFNLDEDKVEEQQIIETIKRDVHFKGTKLWTLIFAIVIASIGLNVNSTYYWSHAHITSDGTHHGYWVRNRHQ